MLDRVEDNRTTLAQLWCPRNHRRKRMARPKQREFPVPTLDIKREILKAKKKLERMEKMKLPPPKRRDIRLELKLLKDCFEKLGNISWC